MNIIPNGTINRWKLKNTDEKEENELRNALNIHPIICKLLVQRGIRTYDEAQRFFRPSVSHLHDPMLMADMLTAVKRIENALVHNEKILIYGDYDVDGTTSVALVYKFFKSFYDKLDYYIPDRYSEGYGISFKGVQYAADNDFKLIIALDCGIKAIDKVEYANTLGVDFIICDHHRPGDEIPKAHAVLNPKRIDCNYPFKELSGCGIGFKLIQAFSEINNIPQDFYLQFTDLVAVSIAADLVPVIDENRTLAYLGLERVNSNPCAGINALMNVSKLQGKKSMNDLVFAVGPRINAAGRIKHGNEAVKLLVCDDEQEAAMLASELQETNAERRDLDDTITAEALHLLRENVIKKNKNATILYKKDWHKGIIGIVASRMIENYFRPTIILTESDGKIVGSARSIPGIDIYEALNECSDLLEQFGGHTYAAGLSMSIDKLELFIQKFEAVIDIRITEEMKTPEIQIDAKIDLDFINTKFYSIIDQMAPFGPGNMRPVFVSENIPNNVNPSVVKDKHLRLRLNNKNRYFNGIAFGMASKLDIVNRNQKINICYVLDETYYNGNVSIQMLLKDIQPTTISSL